LLLPGTVTAEVGVLIEKVAGPDAEAEFLDGVVRGDFEPVALIAADYARTAALVRQYPDFPLGSTDASVVAIPERFGATAIATLDRRHFASIRPRHKEHFTLLPE
jgi:predicted nucleic acid-binding protein